MRLIHFTLQEYLSGHPDIFSRPHSVIAEICLTYLNSRQVKYLLTTPPSGTDSTPFLEYCSVYWGVHAKEELSDFARSRALELLRLPYSPISTGLLMVRADHFYPWNRSTYSPFNGLHCASLFGIDEVVAALIEMERYDINEGDFAGCTPLAWAARNGHEKVVKVLLGREEAISDKPDNDGRTPLSHAACNGHEGVMEILLKRQDVDLDKPDGLSQAPLSHAARNGHEGAVKLLLGREEIDPNRPNIYG